MKRLSANCVGTDAPGCPVEHRSTGFRSVIRHARSLLVSALREIFDESAYNRFLDRSSQGAPTTLLLRNPVASARRPLSIKANPGHTLTTDKLPLTTETKINFPHARPGR
jgi:hypothetical protein